MEQSSTKQVCRKATQQQKEDFAIKQTPEFPEDKFPSYSPLCSDTELRGETALKHIHGVVTMLRNWTMIHHQPNIQIATNV